MLLFFLGGEEKLDLSMFTKTPEQVKNTHFFKKKNKQKNKVARDNMPYPFLHSDHFTRPDKTSTTQLDRLALCPGNILVAVTHSGVPTGNQQYPSASTEGGCGWPQVTTGTTLDVGDEDTSLTRMVAEHRSTTQSPQKRLHFFPRPSVMRSRWKRWIKVVLVCHTPELQHAQKPRRSYPSTCCHYRRIVSR